MTKTIEELQKELMEKMDEFYTEVEKLNEQIEEKQLENKENLK